MLKISTNFTRMVMPVIAMTTVIVISNVAVQYVINDWLTWGAFTYPFVFLVIDLTNRLLGARVARQVAGVGFIAAAGLSLYFADAQIALASASAFIVSQLLDISVFNYWRTHTWWKAPFFGSIAASVIDTFIFFAIAFANSPWNWWSLALGDLAVKWVMALLLLAPYGLMVGYCSRRMQLTGSH